MPHWRTPHVPSTHHAVDWLIALAMLAVLTVAVLLGFGICRSHAQDVTQEYLLSWIPATCCVTNQCCWQVSHSELQSLPDDNWRINSTGQIRKRTAYSPDGRYYRCACDYDQTSKHWVRHQGANTRCVFVPMQTAGR